MGDWLDFGRKHHKTCWEALKVSSFIRTWFCAGRSVVEIETLGIINCSTFFYGLSRFFLTLKLLCGFLMKLFTALRVILQVFGSYLVVIWFMKKNLVWLPENQKRTRIL